MDYTVTVTTAGATDDEPARYPDRTVMSTVRGALAQGYTLSADSASGRLTLSRPDRTIMITPATALPVPTRAQRAELLILASSPGPVVWDYTSRNVIMMRDGERPIKHAMTMSMVNAGYMADLTGKGGPASLTLLAYLVLGSRQKGDPAASDARLVSALTAVCTASTSAA